MESSVYKERLTKMTTTFESLQREYDNQCDCCDKCHHEDDDYDEFDEQDRQEDFLRSLGWVGDV